MKFPGRLIRYSVYYYALFLNETSTKNIKPLIKTTDETQILKADGSSNYFKY